MIKIRGTFSIASFETDLFIEFIRCLLEYVFSGHDLGHEGWIGQRRRLDVRNLVERELRMPAGQFLVWYRQRALQLRQKFLKLKDSYKSRYTRWEIPKR